MNINWLNIIVQAVVSFIFGAIGAYFMLQIDKKKTESNNIIHSTPVTQPQVSSIKVDEDKYNEWRHLELTRKETLSSLTQENDMVDLIILDSGPRKIDTIKVIRNLTHLGLGEAKLLAETPNGIVLKQVSADVAIQAQSLFTNAGALVKII